MINNQIALLREFPGTWNVLRERYPHATIELGNANLSDVDLRCVELGNANLSDADLSGADLLGAGLSGANWTRQTVAIGLPCYVRSQHAALAADCQDHVILVEAP